jgi:formaldehyde-activating enzyme involved in methanogenesis
MFEPFGDIKKFTIEKSEKGQYGYVWYEDKTGKDKQHGPEAVNKAVEGLNDKDLGDGVKLVVTKYISKEQREKQSLVGKINYKSSKKRCNLHVKNFPKAWTEEDLNRMFSPYG